MTDLKKALLNRTIVSIELIDGGYLRFTLDNGDVFQTLAEQTYDHQGNRFKTWR